MSHPALEQGIQAARAGKRDQARALLAQVVRDEPANEQAWLWLSAVVGGNEQKRYCLQRVLAINPHNQAAARGLALLAATTPPPPTAAPLPTLAAAEPTVAPTVQPAAPPPRAEESPAAPPPAAESTGGAPPAGLRERLGLSPLLAGLAAALVVIIVVVLAIVVIRNITAPRAPAAPAVAQAPSPTVRRSTPTVRPTRPTSTPTPSPTATPTVPPTPLLAGAECPFDLVPGLRVECYELEVPEDRAADRGATIHLAVARFHSQASSPSSFPIVFLQGGPGAGALYYFARTYNKYSDWIPSLLQDHDLIVFDQRGTGFSYPSLQCWELVYAYSQDVVALDEGTPWSVEERQAAYMDALRGCRDRLTSEGVNLSAYTTAASAADVIDVLDALGYERADLYGVSYGTRLALAVMRDYPKRVHSVILDSPVPLQTNMFRAAKELEEGALGELFQSCAADEACQATYPDLEQTYRDLVARFDAQPVSLHFYNVMAGSELHAAVVDGTWLRTAVAWGLRSPESLFIVPRMIYDAQAGDYKLLAYLLYLQNYSYCALSLGMSISIECREEILPITEQELAATMDQRSDANTFLAALEDPSLMIAACQEWGVPAAAPGELQALSSDIPVLVIAGQYDPVTPPVLGEEAVRTLSHSYLVTIPGAGHVPSVDVKATCARQIMQSFLTDPSQQPDTTCLAELDSTPFQVPLTAEDVRLEPFVDSAMAVVGVRPVGWAPGAQGAGYLDRMSWGMDPTRVAVQGAVAPVDYWLQHLTSGFAGSGFDADPQLAGQRQANELTWNLYTAYTFENPVDIALAKGSRRTILILMVSEPQEHEIMYDLVFIPMVDAAKEK